MIAVAITTSHPTMTKDVTAPAVILAFSLSVYGRSMADAKSNWATAKIKIGHKDLKQAITPGPTGTRGSYMPNAGKKGCSAGVFAK
jgi:hypothetical protein